MKLTVLMGVYNALPHLRSSIESVLAQTYEDFDFVIVDDASTDGSSELIDRYAELDTRIRMIRLEKNQGLGMALSVGLQSTSAHWIARMDADDVASRKRLATQLRYIEDHPAIDILGTWAYEIDDTGKRIGKRTYPTEHDELAKIMWTIPIIHPSVIFRREAIMTAGSYDSRLKRRQDYDLWCRCLSHGLRFANLPEFLIDYRVDKAHYQRNNRKVAWEQAKIGWKGARIMKAPPIAYVGVVWPFVISLFPPAIRGHTRSLFRWLDPRRRRTHLENCENGHSD